MLGTILTGVNLLLGSALALGSAVWFVRTRRRYGLKTTLRRTFSYRLLLPLAIIAGLIAVNTSLVFIQPTQMGVVMSVAADKAVRSQPIPAGLHWVFPLFEKLYHYPIYWQTYSLSSNPLEGGRPGGAIQARTADNQTIIFDCTIIFRIDPEQLVQLHINWQQRYAHDLLRPALRGIIREEATRYTANEANSGKRDVLVNTLDRRLRQIAAENGLIVKRVLLRNLTFTNQYARTVELKQRAFQRELLAEYQAQRVARLATGEAEKIELLASAEAQAYVARKTAAARARFIRARSRVRALRLIGKALIDNIQVLRYRYIDRVAPAVKKLLRPHDAPLTLPRAEQLQNPQAAAAQFSAETLSVDDE